MNKIYMGIDPGAKGGIAYIFDNMIATSPYSGDILKSMCDIMTQYEDTEVVCCLEQVHAMPGQGVTSMFNFGQNFGYIKGVLEANKIPYQEVPPQTWKKEFSLNGEKEKSIEACKKLFPNTSLLATNKCRKEHDGMAEALLLAEYGRRKFK
jgi:crossover junction endodeoxyribonuclease RuvC